MSTGSNDIFVKICFLFQGVHIKLEKRRFYFIRPYLSYNLWDLPHFGKKCTQVVKRTQCCHEIGTSVANVKGVVVMEHLVNDSEHCPNVLF